MDKLIIITVDDEPLALRGLELELDAMDDVELRAQTSDPRAATTIIERERPHVAILDLSMPHMNGFELANEIRAYCPYTIVLTTHDDMAIAAFDSGINDYLTKPIDPERLRTALDRARAHLATLEAASEFQNLAAAALRFERAHGRVETAAARHIRFADGKNEFTLRSDEIEEIRAERDYVRIVTSTRERLASMSMKETASVLPSEVFVRVHRSSFVNRRAVTALERVGRDKLALKLDSGREVPVGRGYRSYVKQLFSHLQEPE